MKTYIVTEKDLERLQETFSINDDSWWYNARVEDWVETLPTREEFDMLISEIVDESKYKSKDKHPEKLEISTYWNPGGSVSYLREGLPHDHEENLYNWFKRTYPDLNPAFYGIEIPHKK